MLCNDTPAVTVTSIRRALGGEREPLRRLIQELTPTIEASVARQLRRAPARREARQEVEDITQSVFLCLFEDGWRVLLQWDPARGLALHGFVALLARRVTIATLRSRRRSPWSEEPVEVEALDQNPAPGTGPESETSAREMVAAMTDGVRSRLGARGVALFELLFVDERSTAEVCSQTGMTPDAVYQWRLRLVRLAREIAAEPAGGAVRIAPRSDPPLLRVRTNQRAQVRKPARTSRRSGG